MTPPLAASGRAVLSALLQLRGRPAPLSPALEASLPVHASAEAAAAALGAALVESAPSADERPAADAPPAARFLHRYRRRSLGSSSGESAAAPEPSTLGPPAAAVRLPDAWPPPAVDALALATTIRATAEADRAATLSTQRAAAARGLRLELRRLSRARRAHVAAAHEAALDLAVALAERLIGGHLAVRPDDVLGVLRAALPADLPTEPAVLHIHPEAADTLRAALADAAPLARIVADPHLTPGDLVLETADGRRDARLRTRLAALLTAPKGVP